MKGPQFLNHAYSIFVIAMRNIELKIKDYYQLAKDIHRQGGPEKAGNLFEQAVTLEDEILSHFGLPASQRFISILQTLINRKKLDKLALQKVLEKLQKAAQQYLLSTPLSDEKLLEKAKAEKSNPFDILPEIGVLTHDYTIYVYNNFFLSGKANAKTILEEFARLKVHQCLEEIYLLSQAVSYRKHELYGKLKAHGLRFLDAYLRNRQRHQKGQLSRKQVEQNLEECLDLIGSAYGYYLRLKVKGLKEKEARNKAGLTNEFLYRMALYTFLLDHTEEEN